MRSRHSTLQLQREKHPRSLPVDRAAVATLGSAPGAAAYIAMGVHVRAQIRPTWYETWLDNEDVANADQCCLYTCTRKEILDDILPTPPFSLPVPPPPINSFGETRLGNSCEGACYHITRV